MTKKIIGIVGGMGPQAGVDLFNNIIRQTDAKTDQDHLSVVLMSFPANVVDRTAFLEGKTKVNPAYEIVKTIRSLEAAGAELIGIACNTSHAPLIFDTIHYVLQTMQSKVRIVNMPVATCEFIASHLPQTRRVGVMATRGTYNTGIYSDLLTQLGYEVVLPDPDFQNDVIHRMIYDPVFGIKATSGKASNQLTELMDIAIEYFRNNATDTIILGCTEFSIVLKEKSIAGMSIVDSNFVLARRLVSEAMCEEMDTITR